MLQNFSILATTLLGFFTLNALAAPPQLLKRVAPPADFSISNVGTNGAVCRSISLYYALSDDHASLNITLNNFWAQTGPGVPSFVNKISCQVHADLNIPAGYDLSLSTDHFSGSFPLEQDVVLSLKSVYQFAGSSSGTATAAVSLAGPLDTKGNVYDATFNPDTVFSSCGSTSPLLIDITFEVNASNGASYEPDFSDTNVHQTLDFNWSTC